MTGEATLKRKRGRGRGPKSQAEICDVDDNNSIMSPATTAAENNVMVSLSKVELMASNSPTTSTRNIQPLRRGHSRDNRMTELPTNRTTFTAANSFVSPSINEESVVATRVIPSMDSVVKVFCVHTEPDFSLPWQRKCQYSSSSSGFVINGFVTKVHSRS